MNEHNRQMVLMCRATGDNDVVVIVPEPTKRTLDYRPSADTLEHIHHAIGFVPEFVQMALPSPEPFADAVLDQYQAASGVTYRGQLEGYITDEGVYCPDNADEEEPADPDLIPLAMIVCRRGLVYVYPYGIVAIEPIDADTYITRMD